MKLIDLLSFISRLAKSKGYSTPFIVGGMPRDKLLNMIGDINDVDLTTGDKSIHLLSRDVATSLKDVIDDYVVMPDGHSKIVIGDFSLDFSTNFVVPGITSILQDAGIKVVSDMQKELYSRDFTCNTALMSMSLKKIYDPTGLAIEDIEAKMIRTCLQPALTLGYNNRRVVRIIYMAAKLDFDVDENIISWVKENPESFANADPTYLSKKLNQSIEYNKAKVVSLLDRMNLWSYVPNVDVLFPYRAARLS